ncbi:MAG TPA: FixH family protein [Chitinophagaceae bacterium]|nr:FixH family protein [Chitinophagaceae bacterium]
MSWGNKLLVVFIFFGAGISFMVYKSTTAKFDLVSKEYYKDELAYQQVIDGTKKANALNGVMKITNDENYVYIQLPEDLNGRAANGTIWFYYTADAQKDRKFDLKPDANGKQVFDRKLFFPVNYKVKINWESNGERFYNETDFNNK